MLTELWSFALPTRGRGCSQWLSWSLSTSPAVSALRTPLSILADSLQSLSLDLGSQLGKGAPMLKDPMCSGKPRETSLSQIDWSTAFVVFEESLALWKAQRGIHSLRTLGTMTRTGLLSWLSPSLAPRAPLPLSFLTTAPT